MIFFGREEKSSLEGGAVCTRTEVRTPGKPVLRVTRFNSTDSVDIHLAPGSEIALSNFPKEMCPGMDADILLHFLSTTAVPAGSAIAPKGGWYCSNPVTPNVKPSLMGDTTGPGCSNTNYP